MAAGIDHVGKNHRRPAEDVVFQNAAGIYRNVVLNFDIIADHHIRRNHDVLPDIAMGADRGIFHDMRKMPDFCSCADGARLIDIAGFVDEIVLLFHASSEPRFPKQVAPARIRFGRAATRAPPSEAPG